MLQKPTIKFLKDLSKNNNREWFLENKVAYEKAKEDFEHFIEQLLIKLSKHDRDFEGLPVKDCVFRIYRDVRFSKDKTPYKTSFSAQFKKGGKKSPYCGYYLQIDPVSEWGSFIAGGYWMPENDLLKKLRQEIEYNSTDFKKIINAASFKKWFTQLEDHKLKKFPKGVDENHPDAELLRYTSYVATHNLNTNDFLEKGITDTCVKAFKALQPLIHFLNRVHD